MYPSPGEMWERAKPYRRNYCSRCRKSMLLWDGELTVFYCPRCKKTETVDRETSEKRLQPSSGSLFWLETIDPPGWFRDEVE